MSKARSIYLFVLGSFFGISLSLLWVYYFMNYLDHSNINNSIDLNTNNVLNSITSSIKSLPSAWWTTDYKKFDAVWDVLKNQHIDWQNADLAKAVDNALKWLVDSLEDPYTTYFTTTENKSFQDDLKWEKDFEWIGAVVAKKEEGVMIEEVLKWFPAHKAWLKPLDIILEIAWEKTKNLTLSEAVNKIRWPKWSEVDLVIYRQWEKDVLRLKVMRDKIVVPSVSSKVYQLTWWANIGYINISVIWEDTESAFKATIAELKTQNIKWIILDLRWNGWWYLPIATEIQSHFVPKEKTVVSSKYRIYPDETYKSKWYWDFEWYPVVVLVDGMTASASEIIAAWLRDNIWSKLVWSKTFWKWSIQTIYDMKDWSSIKYTIWRWFTPKWENVDKKWLEPDIKVEFDAQSYKDKEYDNQLEKAKEVILPFLK